MILITFGTRPEYIKVLPVMEEMESRGIGFKTFFTGQHVDLLKHIKPPTHTLEVGTGSNRLDTIIQSILNKEDIFRNVNSVLVQGDTSSAFATALAAFHRKILVFHLEAGLRTYNKYSPYPEEFNRRAISALTEYHLCPTESAKEVLEGEGFTNLYKVGNTVLDNLVNIQTSETNVVLVTIHRREKLEEIPAWFDAINKEAIRYPHLKFILPLHPNPAITKYKDILTNVEVVPPLSHQEFITSLASCKFVITDSGGVQEEAAFLGKPCVVCRDHTERKEGLGTFSVLCKTPEDLTRQTIWAHAPISKNSVCPYGDGFSAKYICDLYEKIES